MPLIPVQDMSEAVAELARAVNQLGLVGGVLTAHNGDLGVRKALGHPDFWPLTKKPSVSTSPSRFTGRCPSTSA